MKAKNTETEKEKITQQQQQQQARSSRSCSSSEHSDNEASCNKNEVSRSCCCLSDRIWWDCVARAHPRYCIERNHAKSHPISKLRTNGIYQMDIERAI